MAPTAVTKAEDAGQSGQLLEHPNFLFLRMIEFAMPSSPLLKRERGRERRRGERRGKEGEGKRKENKESEVDYEAVREKEK